MSWNPYNAEHNAENKRHTVEPATSEALAVAAPGLKHHLSINQLLTIGRILDTTDSTAGRELFVAVSTWIEKHGR